MGSNIAARATLMRVWSRLPDTMLGDSGGNPAEDESLQHIIRVGGLYAHDYGTAQYWRLMLARGGALIAEEIPEGTRFTKATEFPAEPEPGAWVDRANAEIQAGTAREQALLRYEREARESAARALNGPSMVEQIADYVDERIDARLRELGLASNDEPASGQLETVSAGNGPQEGI